MEGESLAGHPQSYLRLTVPVAPPTSFGAVFLLMSLYYFSFVVFTSIGHAHL